MKRKHLSLGRSLKVVAASGLALTLTAACQVSTGSDNTGSSSSYGGGTRHKVDEGTASAPRGTFIIVDSPGQLSPEEHHYATQAAAAHRTIYVNGKGATISPGQDNSSNQTSGIIQNTIQIPPYGGGSANWSKFLSCIQNEFARWNVTVTDQDPGQLPHLEAMIGGRAQDAGFGQGVGGVSPMNGDCSLIERAIVYVFSSAFNEDPTVSCEVAAQELGHAIGMDHEYLCADPMTYLQGCGHKTFQDQTVSCGESGPRACSCGGQQNSVQFMNARLGPASGNPPPPPPPPPPPGNDTTAPKIVISSPANHSTLPSNTTISISATITDPDDAVASATLVWEYNGTTLNFDCANPPSGFTCNHSGSSYQWSLNVGSGPRAFTIQAKDSHGNAAASARYTVTLGGGNPPPPPPPTGPSVAFDSPASNASYAPGDPVDIRVTVTDTQATVNAVQLRWRSPSGDALFDLSSLGGNDWGASLQLSQGAVAGTRSLRVTATDANNTKASTQDLTINVQ